MKIKGGGCACLCQGFNPDESQCKCYGCQTPCGGRRACGARDKYSQQQCCRKDKHGYGQIEKNENIDMVIVKSGDEDKIDTEDMKYVDPVTWNEFSEWCNKNGHKVRAC